MAKERFERTNPGRPSANQRTPLTSNLALVWAHTPGLYVGPSSYPVVPCIEEEVRDEIEHVEASIKP